VLLLGLVSAPAIPAASHARGTAGTTAGSTAGTTAGTTLGRWTYAFALYGQARYPEGFLHYDFVNTDAPKGGTLTLSNPDLRSSFDKFNPFTLSGEAPRGVELLTFETLADPSPDEPATMYGLLARAMLIAPDFSSITFQIDSRAHFTNGDPVTAEDVDLLGHDLEATAAAERSALLADADKPHTLRRIGSDQVGGAASDV